VLALPNDSCSVSPTVGRRNIIPVAHNKAARFGDALDGLKAGGTDGKQLPVPANSALSRAISAFLISSIL
jgi:hypothetical protein